MPELKTYTREELLAMGADPLDLSSGVFHILSREPETEEVGPRDLTSNLTVDQR